VIVVVHTPAPTNDTTEPAIVHTDAGEAANDGVKPDDELPASVYGLPLTTGDAGGVDVKDTVCAPLFTVNTCWTDDAVLKLASPA
jgi:hypothetical protein